MEGNGHVESLDELLALQDLTEEWVAVPEWGGKKVGVRSLTAEERCQIEQASQNDSFGKDPSRFRRVLLRQTLITKSGEKLLVDDAAAVALMKKNAAACERLVDAALRLNGFSSKDQEELEKN